MALAFKSWSWSMGDMASSFGSVVDGGKLLGWLQMRVVDTSHWHWLVALVRLRLVFCWWEWILLKPMLWIFSTSLFKGFMVMFWWELYVFRIVVDIGSCICLSRCRYWFAAMNSSALSWRGTDICGCSVIAKNQWWSFTLPSMFLLCIVSLGLYKWLCYPLFNLPFVA